MGKPMLGLDPTVKGILDQRRESLLVAFRMNKLELEHSPDAERGIFYGGDCYLVIEMNKGGSTQKGKLKSPPIIHIVVGENSSVDEVTAICLQAVAIDEIQFGGAATQIRQKQFHESTKFNSLYKGVTISWKKGGYGTALKKVEYINKRVMYKIKGKRSPRAHEVEVSANELVSAKDDTIVFDAGKPYPNKLECIYVIQGVGSNRRELFKGLEMANGIRDNEKGGNAEISIILNTDLNTELEDEGVKHIRKVLDLGPTKPLTFSQSNTSDDDHEKRERSRLKLYKVSDSNQAKVTLREIAGPLKQEQLDENDCFILETGGNIYVWKGKGSNPEERMEALNYAQELKRVKNLPDYLAVEVINQHSEPMEFRLLFPKWQGREKSTGKTYNNNKIAQSLNKKVDVTTLYERRTGPADEFAEDDGSNERMVIYRLIDGKPARMPKECKEKAVFYSGDSYIVTYPLSHHKTFKGVIYFWQGNDSDQIEQGQVARITVRLDEEEFHGSALQVRVVEGKEPPHFLRCFGGRLVVYQGDENGKKEDIRMFRVRSKKTKEGRIIEVAVDAGNLNSNDTFIVTRRGKTGLIWKGKGSSSDEVEVAREAVQHLTGYPFGEYELYEEGNEIPQAGNVKPNFWNVLGGKKEYGSHSYMEEEYPDHEARLFHCYNKRGSVEVEEVLPGDLGFDQDDLIEDDVMFLDIGTEIYIWIGKEANRSELSGTREIIKDYIKGVPYNTGQRTTCEMSQGKESRVFKSFFGVWEEHRRPVVTLEEVKAMLREQNRSRTAANKTRDPNAKQYSYEELKGLSADDLPVDVDITSREESLKDEHFLEVFGMTKEEFRGLPDWKKITKRKEVSLY